MDITSAIVFYMVIWFVVLFCVLPVRLKTQGDQNSVVPGTPSSSPANPEMRKRLVLTSVISLAIWVVLSTIIISEIITIDDIDWFDRG